MVPLRIFLLILVLVLGSRAPVEAQTIEPPGTGLEDRAATVLAGGGNSFGWFGTNVSLYLSDGRWSVHGGLGYALAVSPPEGHPSGVAWAAGVRRYTAGFRSQWFVGLLYGLLVTTSGSRPNPPPGEWGYGPAVMAGWQYAAGSGFTFLVSLGAGHPVTAEVDVALIPAFDIGFGYTW